MNQRVLLVGATGAFGSRLAAMLAAITQIELILAARRAKPLDALAGRLRADGAVAEIAIRVFDRDRPGDLKTLNPWLLVDASGPFQGGTYDLARAAAEVGAHYVDLADGRAFVGGFCSAMENATIRSGTLAVTGASSTPALSHAALAALVEGWRRIDSVVVVISPGARAPRGLSVMQAILGYAGQPVRVFRGGQWRSMAGWTGLRRIDMPGLERRWASLCETPDLDLLPQRFPIRDDALFLAGLELTIMHLGLATLAWAVKSRLLRDLRPLARGLRMVAGLLAPLGTDRGGMIVEAAGEDLAGRRVRARWALSAEAGAGPSTPAAPAAALVRALANGEEARRGAFTGAGFFTLDAIMRELAALPIASRIDEGHPDDPILFRRLLGRRFDSLPETIRKVHSAGGHAIFEGHAIARAGRSIPARLLRRILGLPPTGRSRARVSFAPDASGETWTRRFGRAQFASRLADSGRLGVFEERFGLLRFVFDLRAGPRGVSWGMIGWSLFGLPLPSALAPRIKAGADEVDGRYRFSVVVAHRWMGLLFAYRGRLDSTSR